MQYLPIEAFAIVIKNSALIEILGKEISDYVRSRMPRGNAELTAGCALSKEGLDRLKIGLEKLKLKQGIDFVLIDTVSHACAIKIGKEIGSKPALAAYPDRTMIDWLKFELIDGELFVALV